MWISFVNLKNAPFAHIDTPNDYNETAHKRAHTHTHSHSRKKTVKCRHFSSVCCALSYLSVSPQEEKHLLLPAYCPLWLSHRINIVRDSRPNYVAYPVPSFFPVNLRWKSEWNKNEKSQRTASTNTFCFSFTVKQKRIMLLSRGTVLMRALSKFGPKSTPINAIKQNSQMQLVRYSGAWTYRTAAESQPLYKRAWVQACGGCKFVLVDSGSKNNRRTRRHCAVHNVQIKCFGYWFKPYRRCGYIVFSLYFSYVVVDYLAFILGLGPYRWRISISRAKRLDRCRIRNSTRWWRIERNANEFSVWARDWKWENRFESVCQCVLIDTIISSRQYNLPTTTKTK